MKSVFVLIAKMNPEQGIPSIQEGVVFMYGIKGSPGPFRLS